MLLAIRDGRVALTPVRRNQYDSLGRICGPKTEDFGGPGAEGVDDGFVGRIAEDRERTAAVRYGQHRSARHGALDRSVSQEVEWLLRSCVECGHGGGSSAEVEREELGQE